MIFSRDLTRESLLLGYTTTTPTGGTSGTVAATLVDKCQSELPFGTPGAVNPRLRAPAHLRLTFPRPGTPNGD